MIDDFDDTAAVLDSLGTRASDKILDHVDDEYHWILTIDGMRFFDVYYRGGLPLPWQAYGHVKLETHEWETGYELINAISKAYPEFVRLIADPGIGDNNDQKDPSIPC